MPQAVIINPYWDTLGGGERYTASFIRLLLDQQWHVLIKWPHNISSQVKSRFGIDLTQAEFTLQTPLRPDLLFCVSDGSLPTSLAVKTLIHFQFPFNNLAGQNWPNFLKSRFYTFVCNSQFTKNFIDAQFRVNSQVIYPPVAVDLFPPGRKTNTILYVGRFSHLTQLKNQHLLIESFKRISPQLPGWQLIIAGGVGVGTDQELIASLQALIGDYPIRLITNPDLEDLKKLYAQAKIFWSSSGLGADETKNPLQVEHFGITVVEAMAAGGVPIITNLGGHKEIVSHNVDGLLFSDLDQLEAETVSLISDKSKLAALSTAAGAKSKMFATAQFNDHFLKLI